MANELKHGSVGTELTQAEWEAVGAHVVANQAVGDIIYADTTSQLLRLGIGSTNDVLRVTGGKPDWQATSFITSLGTIATGVWQGTDVGVAYGGTGASTLTDGGVLLGSGTNAITAMAVLTDGQMIVGNGSTDPVAESGATLRTSIGVGTGDSPAFSDLLLGDGGVLNFNSGDVTLTHSSGALAIDGDGVVAVSFGTGTTVAVNDTTASSSSTSGALVVGGGLGVGEDIYMSGANFNMGASQAGGEVAMILQNTATAADSDTMLHMLMDGTDTTSDIRITMRRQVGTDIVWSFGMDNSNSQAMVWSSGAALGTNDRMRLAIATGVLSVDGDGGGSDDPVSLFDSYDDAALARSFAYSHPMAPEMGLVSRDQWEANRALMVEIGVAEWAEQEGGPDRLMYHVQPMMRMLAGGIYQTRAQLAEEVTSLRRELAEVDSKLKAIGV